MAPGCQLHSWGFYVIMGEVVMGLVPKGGRDVEFATDYLERAAARWPERTAVVDAAGQMTFGRMLKEARAIGAVLACSGDDKAPVVLWLGREAANIAASQGAAMSGRPYAPLDISLPSKRLIYMLEVLQPSAVVVRQAKEEGLRQILAKTTLKKQPAVHIYEEMTEDVPSPRALKVLKQAADRRLSQDPLCILFTSGSTGRPKGVVVSHELICRQIDANLPIFGLDENQVRAGQVPLYFTMGAYDDVYSVLATGGRLLLLSAAQMMFPRKLMKLFKEQGVNTLFWVPSMLRLAADSGALELPEEELPDFRFISFAGEAMSQTTLAAWQRKFPRASFVNRYGATELGPASYEFIREPGQEMTLGEALPGQELLLLDEEGQEVNRPGFAGEVCLRGLMALGYWREPELTERAFVQNPLQQAYPERLYRTGDLARLTPEGKLVYLSRRDSQVKHLGYRIELGEIETAAAEIPGLRSACLYKPETDELVLFYAGELTPKEIMTALSPLLPRYMWPARLEKMEELPYTGSGKVDRQALKELL